MRNLVEALGYFVMVATLGTMLWVAISQPKLMPVKDAQACPKYDASDERQE